MSDSSHNLQSGEFVLVAPSVMVFGPIALSDEEGEKLYEEIAPRMEMSLDALKRSLEEQFPGVRVGYNVE